MSEMYLHKDDLLDMLKMMDAMEVETLHVSYDSSSGIGAVIKATATIEHNGHRGEFTQTISDETSW